MQYFYFSQYRL